MPSVKQILTIAAVTLATMVVVNKVPKLKAIVG